MVIIIKHNNDSCSTLSRAGRKMVRQEITVSTIIIQIYEDADVDVRGNRRMRYDMNIIEEQSEYGSVQ